MGLFDTVLSTNWSGTSYNLGIPSQFGYVAQAVALNEHRGGPPHREDRQVRYGGGNTTTQLALISTATSCANRAPTM